MYTPHTVTLYNLREKEDGQAPEINITVLEGVFLDISQGTNILKSGLSGADTAMLFIPFSVSAVNGMTGCGQTFLGAKEYDRLEDVDQYWTLRPGGTASAADCFFVKGRVIEHGLGFGEINRRYDNVYRVSSVDIRDFGSQQMQHWQVGGK